MTFPSADQIALAIVRAAVASSEDPLGMPRGNASHARHMAFDALREAFPDARREGLATCLGYLKPQNAAAFVSTGKTCKWWNWNLVDEIVGELVADQYGEQGK